MQLNQVCPNCGNKPKRTLEQNSLQWPILTAWANQRQWPINGKLAYITKEDWKDILSAAFKRENPRVAQCYGSRGVVMLGCRTSKWDKERFSEWIEWLIAASIAEGIKVKELEAA